MTYEVIGVEDVAYTNKQGNQVEGFRLHLLNKSLKRENLNGFAVEQLFISKRNEQSYNSCRKVVPQDIVEPVFNRYGNVEDILILEG